MGGILGFPTENIEVDGRIVVLFSYCWQIGCTGLTIGTMCEVGASI
jgi:hypothetical protein